MKEITSVNPLVSVILPAYNAEKYLRYSIESILSQTYKNIEFIIINDGSIDKTKEVIKSFEDERIIYLENNGNLGLIKSLNKGLRVSKGKYIARMDADDISLPDRLSHQIRFMERNSEVIVCGGQISKIDENGIIFSKKKKFPCLDADIKRELFLSVPIVHPTVVMRSCILKDNKILYNENYIDAEDYKMWVDLLTYGKFANLESTCLLYRISSTQITQKNNNTQKESAKCCRRELFETKYNLVIQNKITLSYVNEIINKYEMNITEQEALFLSLDLYDLKFIVSYFLGFTFCRFSLLTNLRILKRILRGSSPLL